MGSIIVELQRDVNLIVSAEPSASRDNPAGIGFPIQVQEVSPGTYVISRGQSLDL